jgi:hypothetical protein
MRAQTVIVGLALCLFFAVGLYGVHLGWGTDRDSIRVVGAATSILAGHYQRSRSFGFPLHEAATAVLVACGGVFAANLGSLIVTIAGIVAALRIAGRVAPGRVGLAAVTLCSAPLLLVNASSAIDFGWSFAAGMFLLLAALRVQRMSSISALASFGTGALVALLLRPDNVLFVAAVTLALVWRDMPGRRAIIVISLCAGLLAACVYLGLNGPGMLFTGVTTTRPWVARVARAAVLGSAALGPGGVLALLLLARHETAKGAPEALLRRVVWLAWLLYVPRFVALPDQADYLILPVAASLLVVVCVLPWRMAMVCAGLSALPALATISVFRRNDDDGVLRVALAAQAGAVAQDWSARRFAADMARPEMAAFVASRLEGAAAPQSVVYDTFLPGYLSADRDLVIGQGNLYQIVSSAPAAGGLAHLATVPRARFRAIYACNALLAPGVGWRGWEAPTPETVHAGGSLRCWRTDR